MELVWIVGVVLALIALGALARRRQEQEDAEIREILSRRIREAKFRLPLTPRISISVPSDDVAEPVQRKLKTEEKPQGLDGILVGINYTDANGRSSTRRVTVREWDDLYLYCWCHERRDWRTFRFDRICSGFDPVTGEVIADVQVHLEKIEERLDAEADLKDAIEACKSGLRVLMFLARCDGKFHANEEVVVEEFIKAQLAAYSGTRDLLNRVDIKEIVEYARKTFPDPQLFNLAVTVVTGRSKASRESRLVAEYALKLISADGIVTDEEKALSGSLKAWLEKKRNSKKAA